MFEIPQIRKQSGGGSEMVQLELNLFFFFFFFLVPFYNRMIWRILQTLAPWKIMLNHFCHMMVGMAIYMAH